MNGHGAILTGTITCSRRRITPAAQQQQNTPVDQVLELLTQQGTDALAEALRILLNAAVLFERERFLQAAPYERTPERRDYANGFK
jgi:putative transposase